MKPSNVITFIYACDLIRRVWRCQRCNQNPYIKEEQTTQYGQRKKSTKGQTTIY